MKYLCPHYSLIPLLQASFWVCKWPCTCVNNSESWSVGQWVDEQRHFRWINIFSICNVFRRAEKPLFSSRQLWYLQYQFEEKVPFNKAKCVVHKRKYRVFNAICFDILRKHQLHLMFCWTLFEKSLISGNFAVRIGIARDEDRIRIFFLPRRLPEKIIKKHIRLRCYETFRTSILIQYMILEMFIIMYVSCSATFFLFLTSEALLQTTYCFW